LPTFRSEFHAAIEPIIAAIIEKRKRVARCSEIRKGSVSRGPSPQPIMPVIPSPSPPPPRPPAPSSHFPVCTHNYCMCVGPPAPPFLPLFPHLPSFICRLRPLLPPTNFVVRIELNPDFTPQNRQKKIPFPLLPL
jgi:hypothetical protein